MQTHSVCGYLLSALLSLSYNSISLYDIYFWLYRKASFMYCGVLKSIRGTYIIQNRRLNVSLLSVCVYVTTSRFILAIVRYNIDRIHLRVLELGPE